MHDVQGIRIGKRTFITSALIILSLMIIPGIMTGHSGDDRVRTFLNRDCGSK